MDTNANYETLRKLYFGTQVSNLPSHPKDKNEKSLTASSNDEGTKAILNETEITQNERDFLTSDEDLEGFKEALSQRSLDVIRALYQKYGSGMYHQVNQMIEDENFSEWEQLQQQLMQEEIQSILPEQLTKGSELLNLYTESELLLSQVEQDDHEDLDYLDALVSHDFRRIRQHDQEDESLTSIFSEILENEPQSSQNYEDDVFNKNIALIYNEEVDLDNAEWGTVKDSYDLKLDDAIDKLKDEVSVSQTSQSSIEINESTQTSLTAFYAQDIKQEQETTEEAPRVELTSNSWFSRLKAKFIKR